MGMKNKKDSIKKEPRYFRLKAIVFFVLIILVLSMFSLPVINSHHPNTGDTNLESQEAGDEGVEPLSGNGTNPPIHLDFGWNLVSFPYVVPVTSLEIVLSSIDGKYDAVQSYDSSDALDPWKHYHTSKPAHLNDLTHLDNKMGFWR